MNQIEIWLSILSRKLLRRGSFESTDALKNQVMDFQLLQPHHAQTLQVDLREQASYRVTIDVFKPGCTRILALGLALAPRRGALDHHLLPHPCSPDPLLAQTLGFPRTI